LSYSPTSLLLYYYATPCATPAAKVRASSAKSTITLSPSLNSPLSTFVDSGFST